MRVRPDPSDVGYTLAMRLTPDGALAGEQLLRGPRTLVALDPGPRPRGGLALVHLQGLCRIKQPYQCLDGVLCPRTTDTKTGRDNTRPAIRPATAGRTLKHITQSAAPAQTVTSVPSGTLGNSCLVIDDHI